MTTKSDRSLKRLFLPEERNPRPTLFLTAAVNVDRASESQNKSLLSFLRK